ncbi:hypothetical protein BT67DRAFT_88684 [Trichocladium antarcticum]|uniref:Uncharacterized protein n=1 Tax=Trichocladium antarcticum TaxID=1450529 RepID=A0AAN6UG61_9PEZI|nr:hypothetical protein BT67DRAFT_88684 [Trichocladium antarcticum]
MAGSPDRATHSAAMLHTSRCATPLSAIPQIRMQPYSLVGSVPAVPFGIPLLDALFCGPVGKYRTWLRRTFCCLPKSPPLILFLAESATLVCASACLGFACGAGADALDTRMTADGYRQVVGGSELFMVLTPVPNRFFYELVAWCSHSELLLQLLGVALPRTLYYMFASLAISW